MGGRCSKLFFMLCLMLLSVLFFVFPGFASEAEGHASYWKDYAFQIVNFIILVAILVKFIRSPLKGYLEKRHNQVKEELQKARDLSEAADKAYREAQQRLENVDVEIKTIKEQMLKDMEAEKQRLMEEAEKKAELMKTQAYQSLKEEIAQIKKRLREEISLEALSIAEEIVKKSINKEDQKRLVDLYVRQLGRKN